MKNNNNNIADIAERIAIRRGNTVYKTLYGARMVAAILAAGIPAAAVEIRRKGGGWVISM
jgi:hypothetical protein